jgi:hypothetical protein
MGDLADSRREGILPAKHFQPAKYFTDGAFFPLRVQNSFCKSHRTGRTGAGVAQG